MMIRDDPIVEFRSKEVHDSARYMARSAVLLKPVLLPGGGVPHSQPHDCQKHLQVRLGLDGTFKPVHQETFAINYSDPCHHLAMSFPAWHDVVWVGWATINSVLSVQCQCEDKSFPI